MKKRILSLLLSTSLVASASNELLMPASPTSVSPSTAAFAGYGTASVNACSGTPSIELPLVSVNAGGGHSWPVSIAYNCSGIKACQPAGIVGAGWTLKSAGVITASRNDIPDEFKDDVAEYGWYYRHDWANVPFEDPRGLKSTLKNYAGSDKLDHDTEPDMFNFSFLDYHGTFFLGEDGQWKARCNRDVKVVFGGTEADFVDPYELLDLEISDTRGYLNLAGGHYSKSFGKFTIIDENGNEYVFGGSNESVEYSIPFFTEPYHRFVASAWHLTKVRYVDGRTIAFRYATDRPYIAQMTYNKYSWNQHTLSSGGFLDSECGNAGTQSGPSYDGNLILPVYLTGIESDEDSLSFEYDNDNSEYYDFRTICDSRLSEWGYERFLPLLEDVYKHIDYFNCWYPKCLEVLQRKKLATIKFYKMHQSNHRLDFSYYEGNYLFLTTITDDVLGDKYRFVTYGIDELPPMTFEKSDAWGYHKGLDYQSQDSETSRYGMLDRIIYPTDGYTRFEYERHDYSSTVTELRDGLTYEETNKLAGGLRIKRIYRNTTSNDNDEFIDKEYHYIKDYNNRKDSDLRISSGCLLLPPLYSYSFTVTSVDGSRHSMAFSTVQSLACHDGSGTEGHVGYSEVAEKNVDGTVTVYKFTDFASNPDERPVAELLESKGIKPCSYRPQERGLLKEKACYLPNGRLWKRIVYTYSPSEDPGSAYVKCLYLWGKQLCDNGVPNVGSWAYDGVAYKRYYHVMRPAKITETEYDDSNGSFTAYTTFDYVAGTKGMIRNKTMTYGQKSDKTTYTYSYEGNATLDKAKKQQNVLAPLSRESMNLSSPCFNGEVAYTDYNYPVSGDSWLRPDSIYHSGYGGKPAQMGKYRYGKYYVLENKRISGTPRINYITAFNGLRNIAEYAGEYVAATATPAPGADDSPDYLSLAAQLQGRDYCLYKYDCFGRLIESTKGGASKMGYRYDDADRLTEELIDNSYYKGYHYYTALGSNPGPLPEYGSTNEYNFILTNSRGATGFDNQVDYYDGLGRMIESIKVGFGSDNEDNIAIVENNHDGTVNREYLPVPLPGQNGAYLPVRIADFSIYGDDRDHAFASYTYSGRTGESPIKVNLPGAAWHASRGKTSSYSLVMNPGKYCVIHNGELKLVSNAYSSGELRMTETIDEDGKKTCEIRNRHDLVVRTIMYSDDDPIMTDYVYDEKDNLRYVLPPSVMARVMSKAEGSRIDGTELTDMCYVYTYDSRNNMRSRKLPHCNAETYYYDSDNMLRLSQSALQSVSNEWSFYHYDDMFRPVYKYNYTPTVNTALVAEAILNGAIVNTPFNPDLVDDFYGYQSWCDVLGIFQEDMNKDNIEWVNFYDGVTPGAVLPEMADSLAFRSFEANGRSILFRGELSGRLTRVPADSTYIAEAIYHDSRGRIIQSVSSNILGGYDRTSTIYTPNDLPLKVFESHSTPKECHRDVYTYTYGQWSRLLSLSMTHDDSPVKELLSNTYDALGRLASQIIGGVTTTAYTYHLHGGISTSENPYFSQKLYYEKGPDSSAGCLNGDISSYCWSSSADGTGASTLWRSYTYAYDGADRLISAVYGESGSRPDGIAATGANYSEYRNYDAASNLATLKTYGLTDRQKTDGGGTSLSFGVIKDIRFENVGSQMVSATIAPTSSTVSTMDNSVIGALKEETTFGFNYDAAGNLAGDGLRKETFEYDRFGNLSYALPENGRRADYNARYSYDASGRLHKRSLRWEEIEMVYDRPPGWFIPDSLRPDIPPLPNPGDSIPGPIVPFYPEFGQGSASGASASPQSNTVIWPGGNPRDSVIARPAPVLHTSCEYCGNYEYCSGKLDRINTPVGYYKNGRHYFYLKDYQGNIRGTVADNDSLICAVHYYPGGSLFGECHGYWRDGNLFQGGKLEKSYSHTFIDLKNRLYDPIIPHFTSVDSKSESYYPFNYYNYALCNPVRYRDPDGNDAIITFSGTTITVSANIYLMGELATQELANIFQKNIMDNWGKETKYKYGDTEYNIIWDVKVSVMQYDQPKEKDGKSNYFHVTKDGQSKVFGSWHGFIRCTSRYKDVDFKYDNPMSHELGHVFGLIDRYDTKTNKIHKGWIGNIMDGQSGMSVVDRRNLSAIFDVPLSHYHKSENQMKAINWAFFNWFGQWNYIWRINSQNRER